MGIAPLQYLAGENTDTHGLTGKENFTIEFPENMTPGQELTIKVNTFIHFVVVVALLLLLLLLTLFFKTLLFASIYFIELFYFFYRLMTADHSRWKLVSIPIWSWCIIKTAAFLTIWYGRLLARTKRSIQIDRNRNRDLKKRKIISN